MHDVMRMVDLERLKVFFASPHINKYILVEIYGTIVFFPDEEDPWPC